MTKKPVRIEDVIRGTRYSEMLQGAFNEKGARAALSTFIHEFFDYLGEQEGDLALTMNQKHKIVSSALQAPIMSLIDVVRDSDERLDEKSLEEFDFDPNSENIDAGVLAELKGAINIFASETLRALEETLSNMDIWDMSEVREGVKTFLASNAYQNYAAHAAILIGNTLLREQDAQYNPVEPDPADDISVVDVPEKNPPEDDAFDPEWQDEMKSESRPKWKDTLIKMYMIHHFLEDIEAKYGPGEVRRKNLSSGSGRSFTKDSFTTFENEKVWFEIRIVRDMFRVRRKLPGETMATVGLYYDLRKAKEELL